jgi:hypothetical protein
MSEETESLSASPTWAERLTRAVRVWNFYDRLPDDARMDRVFKEAGVRDLVVRVAEQEQLLKVPGVAEAIEARAVALVSYANGLPEGVTTEAFAEAENLRRSIRRIQS